VEGVWGSVFVFGDVASHGGFSKLKVVKWDGALGSIIVFYYDNVDTRYPTWGMRMW
jgi:hypothetical protein